MASKCSVKVKAWPRWKFRVDWKVPYSFSLKHCSKLFETSMTSPKLSTLQANPTALANCDQRPPPWHARKGQAEHCHIYQHEVLWASPKAWLQMHALIVILCFTPHSSALRWAFAMSSTCSWSPSSLGVSLLDHMSTLELILVPLQSPTLSYESVPWFQQVLQPLNHPAIQTMAPWSSAPVFPSPVFFGGIHTIRITSVLVLQLKVGKFHSEDLELPRVLEPWVQLDLVLGLSTPKCRGFSQIS